MKDEVFGVVGFVFSFFYVGLFLFVIVGFEDVGEDDGCLGYSFLREKNEVMRY